MALASATAVLVSAAVASQPPCAAPLTVTLSPREQIAVTVEFACGRRGGALIRSPGENGVVLFRGDYMRGNARVDRDGTAVLRMIDRRERATDLGYRDGHLELWRGGRRVGAIAYPRAPR